MPLPVVQLDCPPGLEYLAQIDQLLIKQQVELLEGKLLSNMMLVTCEKTRTMLQKERDKLLRH